MLCTPTHTIPNKSHLGEELGVFSTRGNCHPLPHQSSKIVSRMAYFSSATAGRILRDGVPPTEYYSAERKEELLSFATAWIELESIMLSEVMVCFKLSTFLLMEACETPLGS